MSSHISNGLVAPPGDNTIPQSVDWLKLALCRRVAKQEQREYADERTQTRCRKNFELFS
ncbi:hypothetical protein FRC00_002213, partial [Tulasnella sp. 408]